MTSKLTLEEKAARKHQKTICGAFANGAKQLAAKRLWTGVRSVLNSSPEKPTAKNVDRKMKHVTDSDQLKSGEASMRSYVCAMAQFGVDWEEIGDLPSKKELGLAGYQFAIHFLKHKSTKPSKKAEFISEPELISLFLLLNSSAYQSQIRRGTDATEFPDESWIAMANEVNDELHAKTGRRLKPHRLKAAYLMWQTDVVDVTKAVPFSWMGDKERSDG